MESNAWGERTAAIILGHRHRRFLLSHLNGQDGALSLESVARELLEWERETRDDDRPVSDSEIQELSVQLHHEHLPRLDEAGVLTYEWENQLVKNWRHPNLGEEWFEDVALSHLVDLIEE